MQRAAAPPEDRRGVAVGGAVLRGRRGRGAATALYDAALRVVKNVGYVGAGTCEFIADAEGNLFFLEVNARLQVEHPRDRDGDRARSRRAAAPRRRGREAARPVAASTRKGHAIEARVYAEDPSKGFIPKPGPIDELVWAGGAGEVQTRTLRVESGVQRRQQDHAVLRSDDREGRRVGRDARRCDRRARSRARRHDHRAMRRRTSRSCARRSRATSSERRRTTRSSPRSSRSDAPVRRSRWASAQAEVALYSAHRTSRARDVGDHDVPRTSGDRRSPGATSRDRLERQFPAKRGKLLSQTAESCLYEGRRCATPCALRAS